MHTTGRSARNGHALCVLVSDLQEWPDGQFNNAYRQAACSSEAYEWMYAINKHTRDECYRAATQHIRHDVSVLWTPCQYPLDRRFPVPALCPLGHHSACLAGGTCSPP